MNQEVTKRTPMATLKTADRLVGLLIMGIIGSVEILRELHVRRLIPRDEGPPEVAESTVY